VSRIEGDQCPRCGGSTFREHACGPDSFEDDVTYTSLECLSCGLWWDGWRGVWLIDCESCADEDGADVFGETP
jgi:hypothetical protein